MVPFDVFLTVVLHLLQKLEASLTTGDISVPVSSWNYPASKDLHILRRQRSLNLSLILFASKFILNISRAAKIYSSQQSNQTNEQ